MPPWITYSLLALCGIAFVGSFAFERKTLHARLPALRWIVPAVQVLAIATAYLVLRPGRGDDSRARIAESTAHHAPILLDMYSNY